MDSEKYIKTLQSIREMSRTLGTLLDLQSICQFAVKKMKELLSCATACGILMIDYNTNEIKVMAECGFIKKLADLKLDPSSPMINYIINTGQVIASGNIKKENFAACVPDGCHMISMICAPIFAGNKVAGIIHIDGDKENCFTEEDKKFILDLADEISIAVQRALVFEEIKKRADFDQLTNLLNRRRLEEDLKDEVERAKRYNKSFSLMIIDVDYFKKYNDKWGHPQGDFCLKQVANILRETSRKVDRVYRYGGEEFVIIAPEVKSSEAINLAERLRKKVESTEFPGEEKSQPNGKVTISVGLASFPDDGTSIEEILKAADQALYTAKKNGRNRVVQYCEIADKTSFCTSS